MSVPALQVPRFDLARPDTLVVTRWGKVGRACLRPGDRLVLGADEGEWVVLVSRGWGRPMVGRRKEGRLWAEPGGVPVSAARWAVAGGVSAVERELGRGRPLEEDAWVEVRVEGARPAVATHRALASAGGSWMTPSALEALSIQATVAMGGGEIQVAIGVGQDRDEARKMVAEAAWGHLRFSLRRRVEPDALLIVGPWAGSSALEPAESGPQVQLSLFGDSARGNVSS